MFLTLCDVWGVGADDSESMPPHVKNPFMLKNCMKLVMDVEGF